MESGCRIIGAIKILRQMIAEAMVVREKARAWDNHHLPFAC